MNEQQRHQAIADHIKKLHEDIAWAESFLSDVKAGARRYERRGDQELRETTQEDVERAEATIAKSSDIIAAYGRWDA